MAECDGWPRVTEVLRDMGLSRPFPDLPAVRWGRDRGRAVHRAIQLYEEGKIGGTTRLHVDVAGPVRSYMRFKEETGYAPLAVEEAVCHAGLRYRGTLDSRGAYEGGPSILDFKCSDRPDLSAAAYQLGAYALAWQAQEPWDCVDLPARYVIQLREESWRAYEVSDPEAVTIFESAVRVWWAQRETRPARRRAVAP